VWNKGWSMNRAASQVSKQSNRRLKLVKENLWAAGPWPRNDDGPSGAPGSADQSSFARYCSTSRRGPCQSGRAPGRCLPGAAAAPESRSTAGPLGALRRVTVGLGVGPGVRDGLPALRRRPRKARAGPGPAVVPRHGAAVADPGSGPLV
jgi:hypothetical protein